MKAVLRSSVAALAAFAACTAHAQTLKPGLWELTSRMEGGSVKMQDSMAQMQKQLAAMPPEQRKQMEEVMAKQGVKMAPSGPGGGIAIQTCFTKEMVERNDIPASKGDCKTTSQSRTGNTMKTAFTCTNPASTGEAVFTLVSPEAYTSKVIVMSQVQGKPEKIDMSGSGKFLAADCGSVKPMRAAK